MSRRYNTLDSEELKALFAENNILLFTETWLNENHNCNFEGFCHFTLNIHRNNKNAKRDSGGKLYMYRTAYNQKYLC